MRRRSVARLLFAGLLVYVLLCGASLASAWGVGDSLRGAVRTGEAGSTFSPGEVPGLLWSRRYSCYSWEWGEDVVEVSTGGFAMTCWTDPSGSTYRQVMWVVRTDAEGNPLWNHTFGTPNPDFSVSTGSSLVECSGGGFAVAGHLVEDPFDKDWDTWLLRLDADGNQLWNHTYGGSDYDNAWELVECADGGFAVLGFTRSFGAGNLDCYLVRTDADGVMLWNRTYGSGEQERGLALAECSDGGFVIVGDRYLRATTTDVAWVVRTDADGNQLWNQTYSGCSYPCGIVTVGTDLVILANPPSGAGQGVWVIRTNATGNILWERNCARASPGSMVRCSEGGFAIAASSPMGVPGVYFGRIDDDGNQLSNQTFSRSERDAMESIVECSAGGFAMLGQTAVNWRAGDFDFWLLRVTTTEQPTTPVLTDPGTTDDDGNVTLTWTTSTDPDGYIQYYEVQACMSTDFASTSVWWWKPQGTTQLVQLLNGTWYLRVRAFDNASAPSLWSNVESITVAILPPTTTLPAIPGFPLMAMVLGLCVALGVGYAGRRRRRASRLIES